MPIATILHKRVQMGVRDAARGLVHRNHSHKRAELERAMQPADGDLHPHLLRARRKWKVMTCPVPLGTAFLTGNFLSRRDIHTNKQAAASSPTSPCEGGGGKAGAHMQTQAQLTTRICLPKFASDAAHPHASTCALSPVLSFLLLASPISVIPLHIELQARALWGRGSGATDAHVQC